MTTSGAATSGTPHPQIVSREERVAERKKLLADEKEMTKHYDRVNAKRRRLPMVKIEKGRRQLIVYHFMFDPDWEKGCPGCTGFVDALGVLSLLNKEDTTRAVISRAPEGLQRMSRSPKWTGEKKTSWPTPD